MAGLLTLTTMSAQTYTSAPRPVKQVVKSERLPQMLASHVKKTIQHAPSASQYDGRTMYVNLTNSDDWESYGIGSVPYGIYRYTLGSDTDFQPIATSLSYNFMASAMGRDQLLGVRPMELFGALNGAEYIGLGGEDFHQLWSVTYNESENYSLIPSVMAYNPTNDKFYTIQYNADLTGLNLAQWDATEKRFVALQAWSNSFQPLTLAFMPDGRLLTVGSDAKLYELDVTTGAATVIGPVGIVPSLYVQGMGYENRTNSMVWMAVTDNGSGVYALDPSTGATTLIKALSKNEQTPTVFFDNNVAPAHAPAATSDLRFSFSGTGTTSGQLLFTVPSTSYDGTSLTGNVTMSVWLDGECLAEAQSVSPGSQQAYDVSLSNDNHYAYVIFSNEAGFSPAGTLYAFAGRDIPLAVTDVQLTVTNGVSHLTWTAPAGGENNGYIDRDALTYNVVRMPDGVLVAEGIQACEFSETLPSQMARYYYTVTPFNGSDKQGQPANSNDVLCGTAYQPPYYDDFTNQSTQSLWTVINANNDASQWGTVYTWQYMNGRWSLYTSPYNMGEDCTGADDYLVSPGVSLETGITYALIVNMTNTYSNYNERASLLIGTNPNDVSTFKVLASNEAFNTGGNLTDWEADFQVEEAGTYYLAVRGFTTREDNGSGITVNSLAVNVLGKDNAPAEVTNLTVIPEPNGEMQADVSFIAPSTQLNGEPLSGPLTANIYRDDVEPAVAHLDVTAGTAARWTDTGVEGVGMHSYTVSVSNQDGGEGKRVTASAFIGVYTAPYSNTFDTAEDAQFFTTVNDSAFYSTNEYRWIWSSYNQCLSLGGYGYFVQHPVEKIWLYMPAIKLEKDMVYSYSFNWTYSSYYQTGPGYCGIGMAPDSTAQTLYAEQLPFTNYGEKVLIEHEIITSETGKYYPSILMIGDTQYNTLSPSIDDISIKLIGSAFAPYTIENLVAENDKSGALKAYFTFNAARVDYAQRPLEGELKVNIYRSGTPIPVKTFTGVQPGQELTWTDEQPLNGKNSYTIVAVNTHGSGKPTVTELYAGIDTPAAVENYRARGNEDNQKAILTWDAPSEVGVNGGVVDGSLEYAIMEYFPNASTPESQVELIATTQETSYTVDRQPSAEMEQHYYAVVPRTSAGVGAAKILDVVLGQLKEVPFTESFADGGVSYSGWVVGTDGATYGTTWYVLANDEEMTAQDGDNGYALCYNGNYSASLHWADLITPKMKLAPNQQYTLSFWLYTGYPSTSPTLPTLEVMQSNDDLDYESLSTINITEGEQGWTQFELPLTGTGTANYTKLCFRGNMSSVYERLWLDNIQVNNAPVSGITDAGRSDRVVSSGNGLCVEGFDGQRVNVYSIDGRQVDTFVGGGRQMRQLGQGVYIVTVGRQSVKVIVR